MTDHEVSLEISADDRLSVEAIVKRAMGLGLITRSYNRMTCTMDLIATHANGNPMDFGRLLSADNFNFSHDVCGIARHIDRNTGRLMGFFSPRFSRREAAAA